MAKAVAKTKTKKKKWYSIVAPSLFNNSDLGESYVEDPGVLVGRSLSVNLMNITRDPKKQNISIYFKVKEMKDGKAQTYATGYELSLGSMKRFVRRGRDKLDDSFRAKTKDGMIVRVKPLIITNNNTSNAVLTRLRMAARKAVIEECSKNNFNVLIQRILRNEIQKSFKVNLSKLYPVRNFEIRVFKLTDSNQVPEEFKIEKPKDEAKPEVSKKEVQVEKKEVVEEKVDSEEKVEKPKKKAAPKDSKKEVKEEKEEKPKPSKKKSEEAEASEADE